MPVILPESIGYVILIGIGGIMAVIVTLLVKAEINWLGTRRTSEWFSTAGRHIKTGLVAASIVSAWTWAATLLQSSTVAYQFGISGPFWYAAGASIQVVLFAIIAIELKRKAPTAHTFLEVIRIRYGDKSHKVFLFFALATNTIVTSMLVLGGSAAVNALTGVNIYIAAFMIPIGIVIYTFFGGLKATFLADYLNVTLIFIVILIFVIFVYFIKPGLGIDSIYDKLVKAAEIRPVEGNLTGSYLTMVSFGALIFGIINIVGNFGTIFVDQAYWQRAVATDPRSVVKGFLIGGLVWFAIPFGFATTLGLTAIAENVTLTQEQLESGLVAPTSASHVLGDLGAILLLTMIFVAITSAGSAELIAVSSLITYDVYRTYRKPLASSEQLMRFLRSIVILFGFGTSLLAVILLQVGVNLQYIYLSMGIFIGSAVAPITFSILWKKTNRSIATAAAIIGLIAGIVVWLTTSYLSDGEISISSTGRNISLLAGNMTSILSGTLITLLGSFIRSENFDFNLLRRKIFLVEKKIQFLKEQYKYDKILTNAVAFSRKYALVLTFLIVVIWPMPLYISGYIFSLQAFYIWISIALIWTIGSAIIIIVLPLIESRDDIMHILRNLLIPLILGIIITIIVIASILFYSLLAQEAPEVADYTLTFIYSILATVGGFAVIILLLNRKLSGLVELRTKELEKINEELRLKDKLKDQFISIASHELRAPIQPLLGFAMLAKKKRIDNDKAWEGVLKHAQKLQHLANEILDVSRIESGNLALVMEKINLNNLILDAVNAMKPRLNRNVQLVTELNGNAYVQGDKFRLSQVITNILDNSIKFTKNGRITVQTRVIDNKVEVIINDTGPGIPEDIMPNLFGKFVTKSIDGESQQGAGLGLFISRAIIKAHGGDISAKNIDNGAQFIITLTLADSHQSL